MEIPRTLVVTNDFPPRVGGIQRTLESLCRALPSAKVSVIAPSCEGSDAFDVAASFDVVRERRRFVWPTPPFADRVEAEVARTGTEVTRNQSAALLPTRRRFRCPVLASISRAAISPF